MLHPNHRRAFSLIELVIVVVIIGVLAAIAIPRMSSGADGAKTNAVKANLAVLRQAIEMHKAEKGTYPTLATFADDLEDYLRAVPKLGVGTYADDNAVGEANATPPTAETADVGWLYDATSGGIWANDANYFDF